MPFVRTVLGDIDVEEMGITFSHEHIVIRPGFPTVENPDFILNDTGKIAEELKEAFELGARTMVDTMPMDCGRDIGALMEVSKASGVHILAPTGLHLEQYYVPGHWRYRIGEDELAALIVADIETGVDFFDYGSPIVRRSTGRAGLIKLATGDEAFSDHQRMIFRAVVQAHRRTGAPILTHTNAGRQALEQAELLLQLGADPAHIVLSHVDRRPDPDYHRAVLQTGVSLEYDSHFRWKEPGKNPSYDLLENLLPEFPGQLVVGMDMARNSYWRSYGGKPGLRYLLTDFPRELESRGLSSFLPDLFRHNPARIFAFGERRD